MERWLKISAAKLWESLTLVREDLSRLSHRQKSARNGSGEGWSNYPPCPIAAPCKLVRVIPVMRLLTEAALTATVQGPDFSERLNMAFIERVNLTVRHGIAAAFSPNLGHLATGATAAGPSEVVARLVSFCSSSRSVVGGLRATTTTRGQPPSKTLPAADGSSGSGENPSTMVSRRGAFVPPTAGFRLKTDRAGCGWSVKSRRSRKEPHCRVKWPVRTTH